MKQYGEKMFDASCSSEWEEFFQHKPVAGAVDAQPQRLQESARAFTSSINLPPVNATLLDGAAPEPAATHTHCPDCPTAADVPLPMLGLTRAQRKAMGLVGGLVPCTVWSCDALCCCCCRHLQTSEAARGSSSRRRRSTCTTTLRAMSQMSLMTPPVKPAVTKSTARQTPCTCVMGATLAGTTAACQRKCAQRWGRVRRWSFCARNAPKLSSNPTQWTPSSK